MTGQLRFGFDGDGGLGDRLVEAVLRGDKTATSSLAIEYPTAEALPRVGERLTVTDSRGAARAIVETTALTVVPLPEVGDDVAEAEGEGFANAAEWRADHIGFWHDVTDLIRSEIGDPAWTLRPDEQVVVHWFRLIDES